MITVSVIQCFVGDPALSVLTVHVRMDKMNTWFHGQSVKQSQMYKLFVRGHELYFKWKYISCLHLACFQRSSEGTCNPGNQENGAFGKKKVVKLP